jgi:hypothetical protein
MRRELRILKTVLLLLLVGTTTGAWAADKTVATSTSAPSTSPAGVVALRAAIISVKGVVQFRQAEDQPWQTATAGTQLGQGAELRTGLRSAVQFEIEPDQVITLDRLGTVKVLQAFLEHGKATTDLGVKYGRTRYDIQSADLEHQATIRSPGSTLAIRGTDVTYEDQVPWEPSAVSRHGRAEFQNFRKEFLAFGGTKKATIAADKNSAAQEAQSKTKLDPRGAFAGRTTDENDLLLELPSAGGLDAQGQQALEQLARIGGFTGNFIGVPPVPGPLNFIMDWFSTVTDAPSPTSVDFQVTDPLGNMASILHPVIGKGTAMGVFSGSNQGPQGFGEESVVWGLFFPPGQYKVKALSRSGDPASIFITVTEGTSANPIATFGEGTGSSPTIVLTPGQTFSGTVTVTAQAPPTPPPTPMAVPSARKADVARRTAETSDGRRATDRPASVGKR